MTNLYGIPEILITLFIWIPHGVFQPQTATLEKQKAIDAESGNALKSGLTNIFGKGNIAMNSMPFRLNTLNSQRLTAILKAPQTYGLNDLNLRKPTFSPESKQCLKCLSEDYARR